MATQQTKRSKRTKPDYILTFLEAISLLSEETKNIVRNLGFGSILDFSCSSNVDEIFTWLVNKFDTKSSTVTLENGFNFTITPSFVHMILGIPFGEESVQLRSSKEDCEMIDETVVIVPTSVEHLCTLLSNDLDEASFSWIFMQLVLSAFLAPTGDGFDSNIYYNNLINVSAIPKLDWCSFILNWLLLSIEKYQIAKLKGIEEEIGGCKLILVVPYFEFLITSEFNLGTNVPRISLWSTNVVDSYIALDCMPGSKRSFGRLARKHISSTTFKGLKQPLQLHLPAEIQEYINGQFQENDSDSDEAKRQLESLTQKFYYKMVQNSIPALKNYIDDVISNEEMNNNINNWVLQLFDANIPVMHTTNERRTQPELSDKEVKDFLKNLYSFGNLNHSVGHFQTEDIMQDIVKEFKSQCSIDDSDYVCDLPKNSSLENSMYPQFIENNCTIQRECSIGISEYLKNELEGLIDQGRQATSSNQNQLQNYKFSLRNMDFYLPGEEFEGNEPELNVSMMLSKQEIQVQKINDKFLYSIPQIPVTTTHLKSNYNSNPLQTPGSSRDGNSKSAIHAHLHSSPTNYRYVPTPKKVHGSKAQSGLSLNERLIGSRTPSKPGFVTFELLEDDEDGSNNIQPPTAKPKLDLQSIDPLLNLALDQFGKELLENETINLNSNKLNEEFRGPGSFLLQKEHQLNKSFLLMPSNTNSTTIC